MAQKKVWRSGFTLLELLAVIAIIGILATIAVIAISSATKKARDAHRKTDLTNVKQAIELYAQDNGGAYPPGNYAGLVGGTTKYLDSYIKVLPQDRKTGYAYFYTASNGRYVLYTKLEDSNAKAELPLTCEATTGAAGSAKNPDETGNGVGTVATGNTQACFRLGTD